MFLFWYYNLHRFMVNDEKNFIRPVLKHGPRSLTCMRVKEFIKLVGETKVIKVLLFLFIRDFRSIDWTFLEWIQVIAHMMGPERW